MCNLPRRFFYSWYLAFTRKLSETNTAHAERTHIGSLSTATKTPVDDAGGKFRFLFGSRHYGYFCHIIS